MILGVTLISAHHVHADHTFISSSTGGIISTISQPTGLTSSSTFAKKQYVNELKKDAIEYIATGGDYRSALLESVIESVYAKMNQYESAHTVSEMDIVKELIHAINNETIEEII